MTSPTVEDRDGPRAAERAATPPRRWKSWLWGGLFLGGIVFYGAGSGVRAEVVVLFYVYTLLGLGQYIPLRLTDQVSLAYSAYFGIGAYSFAVVAAGKYFDPLLAIPAGMLIAGVLAALVAVATQRLSGYFLAVGTLLVALVFERFLLDAEGLTGGPTGLGFARQLLGFSISQTELLAGGAVVVWLTALAVGNLLRSELGKALLLMSTSAVAAESVGLETRRARIIALAVGAGIASLAGSVFALNTGFVVPESFGVGVSFLVLFIPFIGGAGSPWGCLAGAALVAWFLQVANQFGPGRLMFGLAVLVFVLVFPAGVLGGVQAGLGWLRRAVGGARGAGLAGGG